VLQTVESKLGSFTEPSAFSEIKKQFEELKKEIGNIQEKGLGQIERLKIQEKFNAFWLSLSERQRHLLAKTVKDPFISDEELKEAGISGHNEFHRFVEQLLSADAISGVDTVIRTIGGKSDAGYNLRLKREFRQFLKLVK